MTDYEDMYFLLFNKITDTIQDLQKIQQQAEKMYIEQAENETRTVELTNNK